MQSMKKIALFLTLAGVSAFGADNLVKNGDFGKPELESWHRAQTLSGGRDAFSVVEKDGVKYLRCTGDEKSPKNNFITMTQRIDPPLKQDTAYNLEARIMPNVDYRTGKTFRVGVRQADAKNRTIKYSMLVPRLTDKEVKTYRYRFTPEKNAEKFQFYVWCGNLSETDEVFVADIKLYAVE